MSLKAGRVGVNPEDVNPVNGKIQVEAPDNVYTKTQADNKFETKSHASSTYETKADAEQLQPKTLEVPISMLVGSQLVSIYTVEEALSGLNEGRTNKVLTDMFGAQENLPNTISSVHTISADSYYVHVGNIYVFNIKMSLKSDVNKGDVLLSGLPDTGKNTMDGCPTILMKGGNDTYTGIFYSSAGAKGIKAFANIPNNTDIRFTFIII